MGWFDSIVSSIKKASQPSFKLDQSARHVRFKIDDERFYTVPFTSVESTPQHSSHTHFAQMITLQSESYGWLYLETIQPDHQTDWRGSPGSLFEGFLSQQFQGKRFETLSRYEERRSELVKFRYETHEIGMIWISHKEELFILDSTGILFNNLIEAYGITNPKLPITQAFKKPLEITHSFLSTEMTRDLFERS